MDGPWTNYATPEPAAVAPQPEGPWSKYAAPDSTGMDVLKSAGTGLVRGATQLLGLPGDVAELGATGIHAASKFIGDKIGVNVPDRPKESITGMELPGSEKLLKATEENITGPLHKPETVAGEYMRTGAEFVPAALAGPGSLLRKVLFNAAVPAIASETAGQATKGTAAEPYARAAGGLAGGIAGALGSRAATSEMALRGQMPDYVTPHVVNQADHLIADAAGRGVTLTWPEALSQVTGRPVFTDTQRILESSPHSRATMQNALAERPVQVDQAAMREFDNLGPGTNQPSNIGRDVSTAAQDTIGDVKQIINRNSEPFYQASEGIRLTPQEMGQVRAIPGYREARDAIRNDPQINRYVSHLPDDSVGFLNEVKKYLDQQGTNATSKFNPTANAQRSAGYNSDAATVKQAAIDASRDPATGVSAYEVALNVQQQSRQQYLEPLLSGPLGKIAQKPDTKKAIDALFPTSPLPNSHDEVATAVSALSRRNPMAAQQLVRAHAESVFNEASQALQSGPNQFGGAKFASVIAGNPQQRQNLQAAVEALPNGPARWTGFERLLDILQATGTRQPRGSMTAFNDLDLKAMQSGGMVAEAAKLGLSPGKWMSLVHDRWSRWQMGANLDELARILTDPQSAPMLARISQMPAASTQANLMAARIVAQNMSATQKPADTKRQ